MKVITCSLKMVSGHHIATDYELCHDGTDYCVVCTTTTGNPSDIASFNTIITFSYLGSNVAFHEKNTTTDWWGCYKYSYPDYQEINWNLEHYKATNHTDVIMNGKINVAEKKYIPQDHCMPNPSVHSPNWCIIVIPDIHVLTEFTNTVEMLGQSKLVEKLRKSHKNDVIIIDKSSGNIHTLSLPHPVLAYRKSVISLDEQTAAFIGDDTVTIIDLDF